MVFLRAISSMGTLLDFLIVLSLALRSTPRALTVWTSQPNFQRSGVVIAPAIIAHGVIKEMLKLISLTLCKHTVLCHANFQKTQIEVGNHLKVPLFFSNRLFVVILTEQFLLMFPLNSVWVLGLGFKGCSETFKSCEERCPDPVHVPGFTVSSSCSGVQFRN